MKKIYNVFIVASVMFGSILFFIEDSYAQRYGRSYGSYSTYRSTSGYRSYQPAPRSPRYTQTPRQVPPRAQTPRTNVPQSRNSGRPPLTNQFQRAARSLPQNISARSPVAKTSAFVGQVSKSGLPVVRTKTGGVYGVPQKGVVSVNSSLMTGFNKSSFNKRIGYSGGVDKLTGRIWYVSNSGYSYEGAMRSPPTAPYVRGAWGEKKLEMHVNGRGYKPDNGIKTQLGHRRLDRVVGDVGYEAKAGNNVKLTASIKTQILKDEMIIQSGGLRKIEWHFFDGASQEVKDYLKMHNIEFVEH